MAVCQASVANCRWQNLAAAPSGKSPLTSRSATSNARGLSCRLWVHAATEERMKYPPLAKPIRRGAAVRFGQTEARKKEQLSTLAIAIALAAGGYAVLKYAERY